MRSPCLRANRDREGAGGGIHTRSLTVAVRRIHSWYRQPIQHLLDQVIGAEVLGLGLERNHEAVAEHVRGHGLYVLGRDVTAAGEEGMSLRRPVQRDRRPRARS